MKKFTLAVIDNPENKTYLEEFKNDRVIILTKEMVDDLIGTDSDHLEYEITDILLKLSLMRKYKNLVFMNLQSIGAITGLKEELNFLRKSKADVFLSNVKNLNNNDIFFSKKFSHYMKDVLTQFENTGNEDLLKTSFLFKKGIGHYSFEKITRDIIPSL